MCVGCCCCCSLTVLITCRTSAWHAENSFRVFSNWPLDKAEAFLHTRQWDYIPYLLYARWKGVALWKEIIPTYLRQAEDSTLGSFRCEVSPLTATPQGVRGVHCVCYIKVWSCNDIRKKGSLFPMSSIDALLFYCRNVCFITDPRFAWVLLSF